ncbi:glycosyltransferase family 2 protein [Hymenobacter arizonensis]|uniref:Glycosyltransferase, GT2 family n=1 Tax=Hymenobacter arizonensis TaxID=1227077 RepID=A0A1I5V4C8_HYMAR|nr:glycosyltransferase family 2 protein [Hymenobacter arizonensis]SFQ02369.1 Glycosyltransferase, GT2 family [Hymenobacter arizonensis]
MSPRNGGQGLNFVTVVKLSVVIVNYNVCYFLEQALLSVRRAVEKLGQPVEVFVVDNNSVDGSVAMVKERFPEVVLIANRDNPGFSKANNQALRRATGEYQLLLNPDTVVEEDTFRACCEFMDAHPNCGGLGVKMLDGQGQFLPESKRALPTPAVAFYKMFGLAKLMPKSRTFGRYHLGYLSPEETHEVEVLSGAFMLLRKEALDQVGLLDEDYFMYGEDIDLSYRLTRGGWKNYYYPGTRIIHYKGESTKRTSVNFVFVFYRAMVVFARKHFAPGRAGLFSLLINAAIWLRAGAALLERLAVRVAPLLLDATLIWVGMYFLKSYWENNHKFVPGDYPPQYMAVAVPAYILVWLTSAYLSGAYDPPVKTSRVVRGIFVGTLLISAASNFLDAWRFSKALIILGSAWAVAAVVGRQLLAHFMKYRDLRLSERRQKNIAIVGSGPESRRVRHLLEAAGVKARVIGYVSMAPKAVAVEMAYASPFGYAAAEPLEEPLGELRQLADIIRLYALDELIFCGKDLPASQIIALMLSLPAEPRVAYKILPEDSQYIIGSSSKDRPGDYYTLDIALNLYQPRQARAKRLLDVLTSVGLLVLAPLLIWFQPTKAGFLKNCFSVLVGSRTWVGLRHMAGSARAVPAVLSPADAAVSGTPLTEVTLRRLELLYAKDYEPSMDLSVLWRCWRRLG